MAEKVMQLSKNGCNPPSVNISIQGQDVVSIQSSDDFCVSAIAPSNPFARPLPWPNQGFGKRVTSGAARQGAEGEYKVSGTFSDGTPYDPIIIIDT